jgi:hypothetical protein
MGRCPLKITQGVRRLSTLARSAARNACCSEPRLPTGEEISSTECFFNLHVIFSCCSSQMPLHLVIRSSKLSISPATLPGVSIAINRIVQSP